MILTAPRVPVEYLTHRNQRQAYLLGYRRGLIADLGGIALSAYRRKAEVFAYAHGFTVGQSVKTAHLAAEDTLRIVEEA